MSIKQLRTPVLLGLMAVVWTGVSIGLASTAHANGRATDLQKKQAGPYEIALGTIPGTPIVGTLHLTMTVSDRASGAFFLDARVSVTGTGPGGQVPEIGPLEADNNPISPNFYDVNTSVNRVGVWTFTVSIGGDLGEASTDFTLNVETSNPFLRALTWITVIVFFALVGLGLLPFIRERTRRKKAHG